MDSASKPNGEDGVSVSTDTRNIVAEKEESDMRQPTGGAALRGGVIPDLRSAGLVWRAKDRDNSNVYYNNNSNNRKNVILSVTILIMLVIIIVVVIESNLLKFKEC